MYRNRPKPVHAPHVRRMGHAAVAEPGPRTPASAKGSQLDEHPAAALTFYWPLQARQVRVRGQVVTGPPERSAADFLANGSSARATALPGMEPSPALAVRRRSAIRAMRRGRCSRRSTRRRCNSTAHRRATVPRPCPGHKASAACAYRPAAATVSSGLRRCTPPWHPMRLGRSCNGCLQHSDRPRRRRAGGTGCTPRRRTTPATPTHLWPTPSVPQ